MSTSKSTPTNPWASARLVYRAVETPDDDEFFQKLWTDPTGFQNSTPALPRPQSRADCMRHQKAMMNDTLISALICFPAVATPPTSDDATTTTTTTTTQSKPTPIGIIHVDKFTNYPQHRTGRIGIHVMEEYQGQGYGSEAIRWVLDFSFRRIGLHRVEINAFAWNQGARRLYERLGFTLEGTGREVWWHEGRYWDDYSLGMLDREWEEIRRRETSGRKGE